MITHILAQSSALTRETIRHCFLIWTVEGKSDEPGFLTTKGMANPHHNDLLASAVILQNIIDMSKIIADLREEGWTITEEDLSFLSPYVTPGVKRFGEYGLDLNREMEPLIQEILFRTKSAPSPTVVFTRPKI